MSCIVVSASRVGIPLACSASREGTAMDVEASRIGIPAEVSASRVGVPFVATASRNGKPMQVSARLVCTINGEFYLRVSPDVIWLDPNDATVFVESNVNWIIE